MNVADVTRGLRRRWYIVIPGLLLAVATAVAAWFVVDPGYERSATQLLLPGARSMPEEGNPFLFLGGLTNAADVLVRAVGSENVMNDIEEAYPGVEIEVTRDGSTAGPVILITVTAPTDDAAGAVLETLVERTSEVLDELQAEEGITAANRMTVIPVTIDETSVPQQRDRYLAVALAGIGVAVLAVLVASMVDGLALQRRRRGASSAAAGAGARDQEDLTSEEEAGDDGPDVRRESARSGPSLSPVPDGGPGWAPEPSRKDGRPLVLSLGSGADGPEETADDPPPDGMPDEPLEPDASSGHDEPLEHDDQDEPGEPSDAGREHSETSRSR